MPEPRQDWVAEFARRRPVYAAYAGRLEDLLTVVLAQAGVDTVQVTSRVKEVESFREKLLRKEVDSAADPFDRVQDLAGLRVITYYVEDVERVAQIISTLFEVDRDNSMDKRESLSSDQFGYLSAHFIVRLRADRRELPEWQPYASLAAEIQVRTALQHAWAAVSHKLEYKSAQEAPAALRRRLYRLSALFELADEQFSSIRDHSNQVDSEYRGEVRSGELDVPLDVSSLRAYLTLAPAASGLTEIMAKAGISIGTDDESDLKRDRSDLVKVARSTGWESLDDLDRFIRDGVALEGLTGHLVRIYGSEFPSLTVEDWITQLIIIAYDESDEPGFPTYQKNWSKLLKEARTAWLAERSG